MTRCRIPARVLDFTGLGGEIPIVVKGDVSFGSGVVFAATSGVLAFGFGVIMLRI